MPNEERSFDDLIARCEAMEWGYDVSCWVEYAELSSGGARVAVERRCSAEISAADGATIAIDGAKSGQEALARAVSAMESIVAQRATAGRDG